MRQTEVIEYLQNEREKSMRHAYVQADVESEVAERMGISVDALRARVAKGESSPDPLTRSYALLLSGQHILALAEVEKAQNVEIKRLSRLREAYWLKSRIQLAAGSRHLALDALTSACALSDREKDPAAWADAHYSLAEVFFDLARYAEAEDEFGKVYEARRTSPGASDPETIHALVGVASSRIVQGKKDEAAQAFNRVVEIRYGGLEVDHPEVAKELRGRAKAAFELEQYAEAEPLFQEMLAVSEKQFGPDHIDVAIDLHNLAGVMQLQKKDQEAEPLQRRSLKLFLNYRKTNKSPHRHEESCLFVFRRLMQNLKKPYDEVESEIVAMRKEAGLLDRPE